jgi:REP element-mobilizing transposase RayT
MNFQPYQLLHAYNRGIDRNRVFFERRNYLFFLQKIRSYILPHCDILAYCLMPNHFHLLLHTDERSVQPIQMGMNAFTSLSAGFKTLLSSYSRAINRQEARSGSLFTQNTHAKVVTTDRNVRPRDGGFACFQYIHQNPMRAGLVERMEDWEFSSFRDYAGFRNGTLCNQTLARQLLNLSPERFYEESYQVIDPNALQLIWEPSRATK